MQQRNTIPVGKSELELDWINVEIKTARRTTVPLID